MTYRTGLAVISVIIPVYDRTQFVRRAVRSIELPDAASEDLELIVVTNVALPPGIFDGLSLQPRVLHSADPSLGGKIAEGAVASKGDVLAFLEDDDLWFPGKLDRIRQIFETERDLAYYHNQFRPVDAFDRPLEISLKSPGRTHSRVRDPRRIDAERVSYPTLRRAILDGLDIGLSSIAVRRSVVLARLDLLRQIRLSVDEFMCYSALASGGLALDDSQTLTGYRIHDANAMLHRQGLGPEANSLHAARAAVVTTFRTDQLLLLHRLGERMPAPVRRSLGCLIAEGQVFIDFFSGETRRPLLARHLHEYLASTSRSDLPYSLILGIFGLSNLLSRRAADIIYTGWANSRRLN